MIYSIQRKSGVVYGVRFLSIENDKQVYKNLMSFKTKKDARNAEIAYKLAKEKEQEDAAVAATPAPPKMKTVEDLFAMYKPYILANLSPASYYDYCVVLDKFVLPTFGSMSLAELTKAKLSEWQDGFPLEMSYKYKLKLKTVFSAMLTFGVNRDMLNINPMRSVEKIRRTKQAPVMKFWTKAEFDQFISVVDNPLYKAFFFFLYVSGCRKGEAFALRWRDINFKTGYVSITKSITKKGQNVAKAQNKPIVEQTKNKKTASIFMPAAVLDLIAVLPRGEYVFGCDRPLAETSVARVFNRYIEIAGVKKIRIHDLRHSCAALFISSSNSELSVLYALAARLRDSVDQILKTYGHLFSSRQAEIEGILKTLF